MIGLLITPILNKFAILFAKAGGASLKWCHGTKFYIPNKSRELIEKSMDEVICFFGSDWRQYEGLVTQVVIVDILETRFLPAQGFLIINDSDSARLASPVHLTGWMVSYFQTMQFYKVNGGRFFRSRKKDDLAKNAGAEARKKFLASR